MRMLDVRRLSAATLTAAAMAAAYAAPAADAGYTSRFVETDIVMSGDSADDFLTVGTIQPTPGGPRFLTHNRFNAGDGGFAAADDWDSTTPNVQRVPIELGSNQNLRISSGRGSDRVLFNEVAAIDTDLNLQVNGGDGDDVLAGTGDVDEIDGAGGDDSIDGQGAPNGEEDVLNGTSGNDVFVWNEGNGSERIDGGTGQDALRIAGHPKDDDSVEVFAGAGSGETGLEIVGNFAVDSNLAAKVESASLDTGGGADEVEATGAPIPLEIRGGSGLDILRGGNAADTIAGGDGGDHLAGGGGNDRLIGDRDNDLLLGAEGDDVLVWNNGDGSDSANGDAGFDTLEVNGAADGDAFVTGPTKNGQGTRLERKNLVFFNVDTEAEALDLNGLGGDDTFVAGAGPPIAIDADGGAGNDTLTGASGFDRLSGGSGNDTLTGGAGGDVIEGAAGNDSLLARDGVGDLVRCGDGSDKAVTDALALDAPAACEAVTGAGAPAAPATPSAPAAPGAGPGAPIAAVLPRLTARGGRISAKRRGRRVRVTLPLACPPGGAECVGQATLITARPIKAGRARVVATLGRVRYRIAAGTSRRLTVALPRGVESLAGRKRRLAVRVDLQSQSSDGLTAAARRSLTVALPKGRAR